MGEQPQRVALPDQGEDLRVRDELLEFGVAAHAANPRAHFAQHVGLLIAGLLLHHWLPLNKNLWTASYVIFTAGVAVMLLLGVRGRRRERDET